MENAVFRYVRTVCLLYIYKYVSNFLITILVIVLKQSKFALPLYDVNVCMKNAFIDIMTTQNGYCFVAFYVHNLN